MNSTLKALATCGATALAVVVLALLAWPRQGPGTHGEPRPEGLVPVTALFEPEETPALPAPSESESESESESAMPPTDPAPAPTPGPIPVAVPPAGGASIRLDDRSRAGTPTPQAREPGPADAGTPSADDAIEPFADAETPREFRRRIRLPDPGTRIPGRPPLLCFDWGLSLLRDFTRFRVGHVLATTEDSIRWIRPDASGVWRADQPPSDLRRGGTRFRLDRDVEGVGHLLAIARRAERRDPDSLAFVFDEDAFRRFQMDQARAIRRAGLDSTAVAVTAGTIDWKEGVPVYLVDEVMFNDGRRQLLESGKLAAREGHGKE
ncbi:MAG: hypothetical protein AB7O66_13635 [Limisphaerales bacterium]